MGDKSVKRVARSKIAIHKWPQRAGPYMQHAHGRNSLAIHHPYAPEPSSEESIANSLASLDFSKAFEITLSNVNPFIHLIACTFHHSNGYGA